MSEENTIYPGRAGYTGPTRGLFGFVHHDQLYEWSGDINERVQYIQESKPLHEQAMRLHCLVYIDPTDQPWAEADRLLVEGWRLVDEGGRMWAAGFQPRGWKKRWWLNGIRSRIKGVLMMNRGGQLQREGWQLCSKGDRLMTEHREAILARLLELVPDAPWDGDKLVFEEQVQP